MTLSPPQFRPLTSGPVLSEKIGAVAVVTLNRPDKLNAIDIPLRLALADAIDAADRDSSVRAVVLTGAGRAFCSGGDIASMERMDPRDALERAQLAQRVIRAIWSTDKPVVAAVEGAAFGAGTALAAACDRVVAAGMRGSRRRSPRSDWPATWVLTSRCQPASASRAPGRC